MKPPRPRFRISQLSRAQSNDSMRQALNSPLSDAKLIPEVALSPWRRFFLIACLLMGFLFSILDTTIVSTSLLAISSDLGGFRSSQWVVLSYLLTYMGFSMVLAKLSDIFGRFSILMVSWTIFTMFSVGCGCVATMTQLVICRAFQGIGGAGLYSLTTIALPEVGPADKPEIIGSLIGMTMSISFVLGPVLGGIVPQYTSWRWLYFMNFPFGLLTIIGLIFLYPRHPRTSRWKILLGRIDYPGSILLLGSSVLLVFGLQQAGSLTLSWASWPVVLTLTIALVQATAFCCWEWWLTAGSRAMEPIFPLRLAKNRVYLACMVATFMIGWVYLVMVIALPERFQIANGDSVSLAGLHILPLLGSIAAGSVVAGLLNAKKNRTAAVTVVACALTLLGMGLFSLLPGSSSSSSSPDDSLRTSQSQYGFQCVFGVGVGLFLSSATMMSQAQARGEDHAAAQGAIAQLRVLGGVLGLAVSTVIFNSRLQSGLLGGLTPEQADALRRSPLAVVTVAPELQGPLRQTYAAAFSETTRCAVGMAVVALIASLFTLERNPPPIRRNRPPPEKPAAVAPGVAGQNDLELNTISRGTSTTELQEPLPDEPVLPPLAYTRMKAQEIC